MTDKVRMSRRGFTAVALAAGAGHLAAANAGESSGAARQLPVVDRLALLDLIANYAWGYDTNNLALFAGTFTPDGELVVFGNLLAKGRDSMGAFLKSAAQMRGAHGWQHRTDHHVFRDYAGKACTIYSYYLMPESDAAGAQVTVRAMGYYTSYCRRIRGEWFFARREVHRWNGRTPWETA
jgi:roadblock/LC7 domain-containing protein